jgi:hypothetical protein
MIEAITTAEQASIRAQSASEEVNKSLTRIQESEKQLNNSVAFQNAVTNKDNFARNVAEIVIKDSGYKSGFAGAVIGHDKIDGREYNGNYAKPINLPRKCVLFVTALGNVLSKSGTAALGGFTISTLIDGSRVAENEQFLLSMTQYEFVATVTSATLLDAGSHTLQVEIVFLNPSANNNTQTFDIDYTAIATEPVEATLPSTPQRRQQLLPTDQPRHQGGGQRVDLTIPTRGDDTKVRRLSGSRSCGDARALSKTPSEVKRRL